MRADLFLVEKGYARSREDAKRSILAGLVTVDGKTVCKPSENIDPDAAGEVRFNRTIPYVGRGGLKLGAALDRFGIGVGGLTAVDIGASTGGFTDCLLRRGAARVFAVDSGHGQLAPELLADPRVISMEGFNARYLTPEDLGGRVDVAVIDVSFISQTLIHRAVSSVLIPGGVFVSLIKPQFECGRREVGKGGLVRDPAARKKAVDLVVASASDNSLVCRGFFESPVKGGDGNTEYLAVFIRGNND
ncbi:MAG: TlyA family RNA methyltransferase [Clostridia bacterium]|nr:TlyA family RNA methyltransferase [Clostridia bacterium]